MSTPPRTVYDKTFRAKSYLEPSIMSIANSPSLLGYLEHHSPQTDGSFAIGVAGGEGIFISQALLESIPDEHRPALDTTLAGQTVRFLIGDPMASVGTTFFPFILTDATTGERLRIVVYAIVLPRLFLGMFIGQGARFLESRESTPEGGILFTFNFGKEYKVQGMRFER